MFANNKKVIFFFLFILTILGFIFYSTPQKFGIQNIKSAYLTENIKKGSCKDCNVILISVDSLRADHIGVFGYNRNTTPNFDKFIKTGALFLNYFTTSFLTPVSEMSVQTGLYPSANGVTNFDTVLPKDKITIAQYLKSKDYKTSAILSSPEFEINIALKESFSRGFDRYKYFLHKDNSDEYTRQFPSVSTINSEFKTLGDNKFFLWLALGGIHWPYGEVGPNVYADSNYKGYFKKKSPQWFNVFENIYQGYIYPRGTELQDADVNYIRDQYDNGIRAFDNFFGQLTAELQKKDLLKNTIIVVESEHGEDLGEHGYFAHYDIMDTQVHTPLFIFSPKVKSNQKISSFASSVDVFPTITDLLDNTLPNNIQGKSLEPIITGKEKDGLRNEVFIERNPLWEESGIRNVLEAKGIRIISGIYKDIAIRTSRWKYILRTSQKRMQEISWWQTLIKNPINFPQAELYDLINDPLETKNIINKYPKEADILRKKLDNWFAKISTISSKKIEHKGLTQPYF